VTVRVADLLVRTLAGRPLTEAAKAWATRSCTTRSAAVSAGAASDGGVRVVTPPERVREPPPATARTAVAL